MPEQGLSVSRFVVYDAQFNFEPRPGEFVPPGHVELSLVNPLQVQELARNILSQENILARVVVEGNSIFLDSLIEREPYRQFGDRVDRILENMGIVRPRQEILEFGGP